MSQTDETTLSEVAAIDCSVCGKTMRNTTIVVSFHSHAETFHLCSVQCHVEKIWRDVR